MPLSDVKVRTAKCKDKAYKLADEKGMYLLVTASGGKLWRFDYRYLGKRKTLSLGSYPDVSLSDARERCQKARKQLVNGIDPSVHKRALKATSVINAANTFEMIGREFVESRMSQYSTGHQQKVLRQMELYLFPWIGQKPVGELSPQDILACVKRVQSQNKMETAHRILQSAGQVFRYAVQTGRAHRDVTADLRGVLPSQDVKHMPAPTDPEEVRELLIALDGFKGSMTVMTALRLAPLVFVRPGELRSARWADIDLADAEWKFIVTKTKTNHLVPLSRQAVVLLEDIKHFSGHGEYVFPGGHDPKKCMSEAAINAALKRLGFDTR
ncbi:tyrosine-type recombinase/integrase, partial [Methylicorpusculum sp.]|uniref:tyrosine-type recombinase/integrase n=1 Tax=Methylicorpusculum sp. TaxID=2713644 RepID=UPI002ABCB22D